MKLLRDFFRLRVTRQGRRAESRSWTITVPAPLSQAPVSPSSDSQHRQIDAPRGHQVARRSEHAVSSSRHLTLVSSH